MSWLFRLAALWSAPRAFPKLMLWLGYLITAASLIYLLRDIQLHAGALPENWTERYGSLWFGLAVLFFVASVSCGLLIWVRLLHWELVDVKVLPATNAYLVSQIGKYIPGNIAQHFGRVFLAGRQGIPAATTTRLIIIEVVTVVTAAVSLITAACLFQTELRDQLLAIFEARRSPATIVIAAGIAVAVMLAGAMSLTRLASRIKGGRPLPAISLPRLLQLLGLGLMAFVALGASFHVLLAKCLMAADPGFLSCIAWITASWLISFLTPGAPAGLGVRELVLVTLVAAQFGQPVALESAFAFRGVSVVGDLVVLGLGLLAGLYARRSSDRQEPGRTT